MPGTSKPVATRLSDNDQSSPEVAQGFSWHDARPLTFYTMNVIMIIIIRCVGGVGAFSLSTSYNEMCGLLKCIALHFQKTHNNQYNGYLLAITCAPLLLLALTSGTFAVPFTSNEQISHTSNELSAAGSGGSCCRSEISASDL